MASALRAAGRFAGAALGVVLAGALLFALGAWIGSAIPRNPDWRAPSAAQSGAVTILVGSNGVHTEIVMPYEAAGHDWRALFAPEDAPGARAATHVSVSYGERRFFLATPTWADFSLPAALAALAGGEALIHVAHLERPRPSPAYRPLALRARSYRALVRSIEAELAEDHRASPLGGYGKRDVFYRARSAYHLGNTCNQWTSDRLAEAGVRIGAWTPLAGGVMKWMPQRSGG